jgi:hypothetical protein
MTIDFFLPLRLLIGSEGFRVMDASDYWLPRYLAALILSFWMWWGFGYLVGTLVVRIRRATAELRATTKYRKP